MYMPLSENSFITAACTYSKTVSSKTQLFSETSHILMKLQVINITDPFVSLVKCRFIFCAFSTQTSVLIVYCMGNFLSIGKTSPQTKVSGSKILLYKLYYEIRSQYSQEDRVGYSSAGGPINYTLQLRSYGFN